MLGERVVGMGTIEGVLYRCGLIPGGLHGPGYSTHRQMRGLRLGYFGRGKLEVMSKSDQCTDLLGDMG